MEAHFDSRIKIIKVAEWGGLLLSFPEREIRPTKVIANMVPHLPI